MEKKLIALAVAAAAFATGASANTIYSDDQTTVGLKGEIDAYLSQTETKTSGTTSKTDADIDLWAKIQIDADHKLSDSVTVFGSFEIENGAGFGADGDDKNVSTDDLYIGANLSENFGFAVGEVGDFGDSLDAIVIDNTNEGLGFVDDYANSLESDGHGVSLKYTTAGLTLIGDAYLSESEDTDTVYGVSASYDIANFNLGASYQAQGNNSFDDAAPTNDGNNDVFGVKIGYGADNFSIAAHYVAQQSDDVTTDAIGVAADYTIDELRLYTTVFGVNVEDNDDDSTTYTIGADYAFSGNLTGFVEYVGSDNYGNVDGDEYSQAVAGVYFAF